MVHVHQHQRQRAVVPRGQGQLLCQVQVEGAAVGQLGQAVLHRKAPQAGVGCLQRCGHLPQLRLVPGAFAEQHDEQKARRQQAIDAPHVPAQVVTPRVEQGGHGNVQQPDTHHHLQPDIKQRMGLAAPQQHQRGQAEQPDTGQHQLARGRGAVAIQKHRQVRVPGGGESGPQSHHQQHHAHRGHDAPVGVAALHPLRAAWLLVFDQGVGHHGQWKARMPQHVQRGRGLRP